MYADVPELDHGTTDLSRDQTTDAGAVCRTHYNTGQALWSGKTEKFRDLPKT
jgi:hypothetical protein